jgi:methionyl-tRNA formyltransferase
MKIVFFGSSLFSLPSLRVLSPDIGLVVTKKPKPRGRGYLVKGNEVKEEAERLDLPVLEIDSFKAIHEPAMREVEPDLFVVVSFGLIIPKSFLEIPKIGSLNVHPSLLPKYRGPSPIQWAILSAERVTGITIIKMNEWLDAGDIVYQEESEIFEKDNQISLSDRLSRRASEILPQIVAEVVKKGKIEGVPQRHDEATYTPLITKEMGRIDWRNDAAYIERQVRAFLLWPNAYTFVEKKMLKIFDADVYKRDVVGEPGRVVEVTREGIVVCAGKRSLLLKEVQLENKRRMRAAEFSRGFRGLVGKVFV